MAMGLNHTLLTDAIRGHDGSVCPLCASVCAADGSLAIFLGQLSAKSRYASAVVL